MIKSLRLENFISHRELIVRDIPQINVLIGKNDTGKTAVIKLMYAVVKALDVYSKKKQSYEPQFSEELAQKILTTFMPRNNGLGDLVRKKNGGKLEAEVSIINNELNYNQLIHFSLSSRAEKNIPSCTHLIDDFPHNELNAVFIPAKEVLTAFNDIRNIRDKFYGVGFDDTYLDLIRSLSLPTSPGRVSSDLSNVNRMLENLFEGQIKQQAGNEDQPFIFKKGRQKFSMQLTAEGIKKIGILTTLINNRQIGRNTILFLDEPETALHPGAVRDLVKMLIAMSKYGVQIFMATHSYFVLKQLALESKKSDLEIGCWSFDKTSNQESSFEFSLFHDGVLPSNSIVQEVIRLYEDEIRSEISA